MLVAMRNPHAHERGRRSYTFGNDPDQKHRYRTSKAQSDLRDLLRKFVRRGSLEAWLGEIPYMQSTCSVWERGFESRVNSMIPSDSVPMHISLLDD